MARLAIWSWAVMSVTFAGVANAQVDDPDSLLWYSNGAGTSFRWSFAEDGRIFVGDDADPDGNGGGIDGGGVDPGGGGNVWPSCGTIVSGSSGAFAYFGYLSVTGERGEGDSICPSTWDIAYGDRGFIMDAVQPWGVEVQGTRQIFVPADADFTRWADRIENISGADQDLTVSYSGSFGWQAQMSIVDSSSGDSEASTADNWVVVDDNDPDGGVPAMAVVWQSEDSETKANSVQIYDWGDFNLSFPVSVLAGGTGTVVLFAVQASTREGAATLAEELSQLGSAGADELDDDMDFLINFVPSAPGSPRVRMNGPHVVTEGGNLVVHATAEDPEQEAMTYAWDLDDDGQYDDLSGTLDAPVSAAAIDGPAGIRIGLRVTDASAHVVERHTTVSVANAPPVVSSEPGTTAHTAEPYEYQIVATDFPGDAILYSVDDGPPGLSVNAAGLVRWTPAADGRGPDVPVVIEIRDDDGGSIEQAWTITLSGAPFVQPGGPYRVDEGGEVRLSPIVSDAEGDTLSFAWDLDSDHQYDDSTEASAVWSAAGIDGPADGFEVGLVVSDGEYDVSFQIPVEVRNVGPRFNSEPPTQAVIDREWVYQPDVTDPGGDAFTVEVDEDEIPAGMVMEAGGTLRWTPTAAHLVQGTFEFQITAQDEDRGRTRQDVVLQVRENAAPPVPNIAYPDGGEPVRTLRPNIILENVDDPDGDPVEYFIEVDRDLCFCSPDKMSSGALAEGDLVTQWQLPRELVLPTDGSEPLFYVRRWASDGLDDSEQVLSLFEVDPNAPQDDDEKVDKAGCACRAAGAPTGADGSALVFVGGIGLALVLGRRRRAR